ncbi:MAG: Long-chain-fatty-acid--CoA ligase FadD15 [Deltaproteobacteria bacterium ADurb.Bin510]|nr:MAG: Long-chain-fatty-acid--CoA ligase FadD15 [Deltaproteobacteria bacterium ADurb.Bin510]
METKHLAALIKERIAINPQEPALCLKENGQTQCISFREMGQLMDDVARALIMLGLEPGEKAGIFSQNRPEWTLADLGCMYARVVSVPIYATNTAHQAEYILNDAGIKLLFVGDEKQYEKINSVRAATPQLARVVLFDQNIRPAAGDLSWDEFLKLGQSLAPENELKQRQQEASPEDVATLIYTSGTTGEPKGAVLTHANITFQFATLNERFALGPGDRSLCFLPLSHAYERGWSIYILSRGCANYYLKDPKRVIESMAEVKPTAMVSVPRLYEKIYATAKVRIDNQPLKKLIFKRALATGHEYYSRLYSREVIPPRLALRHALADRLVLSKIRDIVGGHKKCFSAGGAPLSREIEEFFLSAGLLVCQGYGVTEAAPMLACNSPSGFRFGSVGRPILGCTIRIAPGGEILAKGLNIMQGYNNKPADTAATITDGWFHTGDIGYLDHEGFLYITGRIKELIITAQGKNIAPLRIETLIGQDHYIEQIALIGDKRPYLTALIVPAFEALADWARQNDITFDSRTELLHDPRIVEFYKNRIATASTELADYEKVKRFTLMEHEFTQEAGELTPTLKIKRHIISERYADRIDAMYAN